MEVRCVDDDAAVAAEWQGGAHSRGVAEFFELEVMGVSEHPGWVWWIRRN